MTELSKRIQDYLALNDSTAGLSDEDKRELYLYRCEAAGLDPTTQPLAYYTIKGKETLYAKRSCTDQLQKIHDLSVEVISTDIWDNDICVVRARVTESRTAATPTPRFTEEIGAVALAKGGEARANGILTATTKAKRRAILSHTGNTMLDETEVATIPGVTTQEIFGPEKEEAAEKQLTFGATRLDAEPKVGSQAWQAAFLREKDRLMEFGRNKDPDAWSEWCRECKEAKQLKFDADRYAGTIADWTEFVDHVTGDQLFEMWLSAKQAEEINVG